MTMSGKGPETETTRVGGQGALSPVIFVSVQAHELLEASAHLSVEGLQGASVVTGRHCPDGVDHLAKAGTATKQLQGNLWVWDLAEGSEDPERLVNPSMCVLLAEVRSSDRPSQQFEVTVPDDFEVGWELGNIDSGRRTAG